ncbi:MAG: class I SAM-dependent methyltransferase [bacterium]|nr:class I SAM-dependent methyltransferase [bacterium]
MTWREEVHAPDMLHEIFTYLTTPCPAYVRRMRYLYEIIAMRARYQRNRAAWQPHLENTRAFILAAAEQCEARDSVAVYGAGLLLDVPLAELASRFREVYLLDIVFLREARRKARRHGNVSLVQHDATNVAEALCRGIRQGVRDLPEPDPTPPECVRRADLVVSLNLMSQLWVLPRAYVRRHREDLEDAQLDAWCGRIVAAHHALLRSLDHHVCLVADRAYVKRDGSRRIVDTGSTIYDLRLPEPDAGWAWDLAPPGEDDRAMSTELIVGAWRHRIHEGPG